MSAIFGILRFDGRHAAPDDLKRMAAALRHRGPDGQENYAFGAASLGFCRMRVTVEDRFDTQPLQENGTLLVADARLDNRDELAAKLDIASLDRVSDAVLLLAAWRRWGEGCAEHLIGDFAVAVWDGKRLVLIRDHMGQRPIHYHRGADFVAFASEAKALHALPGVPRALNDTEVIRAVLRDAYTHDGADLFAGIKGVSGGTALSFDTDGTMTERRYWTPHAAPEHMGRDLDYYIDAYRRVVGEAVACRVRRLIDPPGVLLSGGFDSAAIAGLAAPALKPGHSVIAVTSALPEGAPHHVRDARRGAEWCRQHMPHLRHRWFVREREGVFESIEQRNAAADRVPYPIAYVEDAMLAMLRDGGARIVMDGIGGDATVNPRVPRFLNELFFAGKLGRFASELRAEARVTGTSLYSLLRHRLLPTLLPQAVLRAWLRLRHGGGMFIHPYVNTATAEPLVRSGAVRAADPLSTLDRMSDIERRVNGLRLVQSRTQPNGANQAAAHGLELTRPMLDKRVVELGLAIPAEMQIVKGRNRYLACRALQDVLPPQFQTRPRGQEYLDADFAAVERAAMPRLREELARMQGNPALGAYVDLERMQRDANASDTPPKYLVHAFLVARYVAWFRRDNI